MSTDLLEEIFISYFKENPLNTYEQFRYCVLDNYPMIHKNLRKEIDNVRKRLQRSGKMLSTVINGSDGKFLSNKKFIEV